MQRNDNIQNISVKSLAFGGVLLAILIIDLYLSNVLPTGRLSLLVASSFFVAVAAIELGKKYIWIFYVASAIFAILFLPDKIKAIIYITFFGLYPILRLYIDKLHNVIVESLIKLVYFNIVFVLTIYFAYTLLIKDFGLQYPIYIIIIIGQISFFVYDFLFTSFVTFYFKNIKKRINP
jgi:hypothetical protein